MACNLQPVNATGLMRHATERCNRPHATCNRAMQQASCTMQHATSAIRRRGGLPAAGAHACGSILPDLRLRCTAARSSWYCSCVPTAKWDQAKWDQAKWDQAKWEHRLLSQERCVRPGAGPPPNPARAFGVSIQPRVGAVPVSILLPPFPTYPRAVKRCPYREGEVPFLLFCVVAVTLPMPCLTLPCLAWPCRLTGPSVALLDYAYFAAYDSAAGLAVAVDAAYNIPHQARLCVCLCACLRPCPSRLFVLAFACIRACAQQ